MKYFFSGLLMFLSTFVFSFHGFALSPTLQTVDGTLATGRQLDISGAGFGTKPTAPPVRYDDFEELTTGQDIAAATGWWTNAASNQGNYSTISTENNRNGSDKNVKASLTTETSNPQFFRNNVGFAATGKIFVSLWVRWDWPEWTGGTQYEATQTKAWRVAAQMNDNGNVIYPAINSFNWLQKDYSYSWTTFNTTYYGGGSDMRSFENDHLQEGQWQNFVLQVDQGTPGNSDGTVFAWLSKPGFPYIGVSHAGTGKMVVDATGSYMDAIKIDNYLDANNQDLLDAGHHLKSTLHWDDIYIDNSWARVEIGDEAVYSDCTHREVQIPTEWSDDSITVTANAGAFAAGEPVYLFVVNAEGEVSEGFGPLAVTAASAPRVQSVTIDGNSRLIINGSGFGVKNPPEPILWETFENGDNGQPLPTDPNWKVKNPPDKIGGWFNSDAAYSGDLAGYNRVHCPSDWTVEQCDHTAATNQFNTSYFSFSPASDEVYYTYRWRYDVGDINANNYGVVKFGRINSLPNIYNGAGSLNFDTFNPADPDSSPVFRYWADDNGYTDQKWANSAWSPPRGEWVRHEMYQKASTPGQADGVIWLSNVIDVGWDLPAVMNRAHGLDFQYDNILLPLMMANPSPGGDVRMWVDDVYVDKTRARVEIGDASDFSACNRREIQIPTAWSNDAITVAVNMGSFNADDPVYLFVVNEDGEFSNGYGPLVFDSGSPETPETPETPDSPEAPDTPETPTANQPETNDSGGGCFIEYLR